MLGWRQADGHGGEEGGRRHLALPVERGGVADIGDAVADRFQHAEGRHTLRGRIDRDVDAPARQRADASATRSADMPGPGRRFGHEVTIFHFKVLARADRWCGEDAGAAVR